MLKVPLSTRRYPGARPLGTHGCVRTRTARSCLAPTCRARTGVRHTEHTDVHSAGPRYRTSVKEPNLAGLVPAAGQLHAGQQGAAGGATPLWAGGRSARGAAIAVLGAHRVTQRHLRARPLLQGQQNVCVPAEGWGAAARVRGTSAGSISLQAGEAEYLPRQAGRQRGSAITAQVCLNYTATCGPPPCLHPGRRRTSSREPGNRTTAEGKEKSSWKINWEKQDIKYMFCFLIKPVRYWNLSSIRGIFRGNIYLGEKPLSVSLHQLDYVQDRCWSSRELMESYRGRGWGPAWARSDAFFFITGLWSTSSGCNPHVYITFKHTQQFQIWYLGSVTV